MGREVPDGAEKQTPERRIRRARETTDVLKGLLREPTQEKVVAFHELHARHLRELGDEVAAARAEERADQARRRAAAPYNSSPSAFVRTGADAGRRRLGEGVSGALDKTSAAEGRSPDVGARGGSAQRPQAGGATQAQHARAGSQRGRAALQRAVEGHERAEADTARETAARERLAAARRRLDATRARAAASALRSPLGEREDAVDERDSIADERERTADERERIAEERDARADRRDKVADRRETVADERERAADNRDKSADERERFALLRRGVIPEA